MKDTIVFVNHINDAISDIEEFIKNCEQEDFFKSKLIQSAVIRQIEIIGEATKNIPSDFKEKYPYVEWKDMAGMRDKLIHNYFGVSAKIVWKVIKNDLPKLKADIQKILQK